MKKYEFTGKERNGLKQIVRISDGKIGGWIRSEKNLSHHGKCWISQNVKIYENAKISGNAQISGNIRVCGNTQISKDIIIDGNMEIANNSQIPNTQISNAKKFIGNKDNKICLNCGKPTIPLIGRMRICRRCEK